MEQRPMTQWRVTIWTEPLASARPRRRDTVTVEAQEFEVDDGALVFINREPAELRCRCVRAFAPGEWAQVERAT